MKPLTDEQRELAGRPEHVKIAMISAGRLTRGRARHGLPVDAAEVRSAAMLALCQCAAEWTPARGASFKTYLFKFHQGRTVNVLRATYGRANLPSGKDALERRMAQFAPVLDERGEPVASDMLIPSREPDVGTEYDAAEYVERVTRHVPKEHRELLRAVLAPGAPCQKDIGRAHGYDETHTSHIVKAAVARLRDRVDLFA